MTDHQKKKGIRFIYIVVHKIFYGWAIYKWEKNIIWHINIKTTKLINIHWNFLINNSINQLLNKSVNTKIKQEKHTEKSASLL